MASKIRVIASAALTGLGVIAAFIVFFPNNEPSTPPEHEGQTQQTAVEAPAVERETQQAPPKMGRGDGLAGGGADDRWQTVQSDGREIFVMTNGPHSGGVFYTYIVANLPESTIVGAPQSVMHDIEGNCETRHYHVRGSLLFSGKNRSGMAMESTPPEDFERKLVPNSPFEKAFEMLCKIAREAPAPRANIAREAPAPRAAQNDARAEDDSSNASSLGLTPWRVPNQNPRW
jgi:hypothetical protein